MQYSTLHIIVHMEIVPITPLRTPGSQLLPLQRHLKAWGLISESRPRYGNPCLGNSLNQHLEYNLPQSEEPWAKGINHPLYPRQIYNRGKHSFNRYSCQGDTNQEVHSNYWSMVIPKSSWALVASVLI